ncbi:unnamed protein product [Calicophoron daubneyi]|uniref:alanine transaminase n=1 Tax=Calicophoron daubneyi TaxID=300641 RepID=A0AAV2TYL9_CALDB
MPQFYSALHRANVLKLLCRNYNRLSVDTINPHVVKVEYAVRGPIVQRAAELEGDLKKGKHYNFDQIIRCNIGDCHASGQQPIKFIRQVLSVATDTSLLKNHSIPSDARLRAQRFLDSCGGSVGVYSHSNGVQVVRDDIARYIEERDNIPSNPNDIFLSTGASEAVKILLQLLATGADGKGRAGILAPIPQYPLYSATNAEYNSVQMGYYLDEDNEWSLSIDALQDVLKRYEGKCVPRALIVINPGNPTGQVLSKDVIRKVIEFAHHHNLVIMADEVYQHNIYVPGREFVSFKKVLHEMGGSISKEVQLASFMSCSKGFMGECGLRGGYCELVNFDPAVQAQLYKYISARLCSSLLGQLAMDVVVNPPKKGEESYESFMSEKKAVLDALKFKAEMVSKSLNELPGFRCNPIQGAMYAFPQMKLPQGAIDAAKKSGVAPDFFYCLKFLENSGVCLVPGSGFAQVPGTWHFRITILPSVEKMKIVMRKLADFHKDFLKQYS